MLSKLVFILINNVFIFNFKLVGAKRSKQMLREVACEYIFDRFILNDAFHYEICWDHKMAR